jgi:hypothetical protein
MEVWAEIRRLHRADGCQSRPCRPDGTSRATGRRGRLLVKVSANTATSTDRHRQRIEK